MGTNQTNVKSLSFYSPNVAAGGVEAATNIAGSLSEAPETLLGGPPELKKTAEGILHNVEVNANFMGEGE